MGRLAQLIRTINPKLGIAFLGVVALLRAAPAAEGPPISFSLSLSVGRSPAALAVADLNRDGRGDLIVANSESDSISLLYGSGPGNFLPALAIGTAAGPNALAVADLNRDFIPDLVVTGGVDDVLMAFHSRRAGGLDTVLELPTGTGPAGVATADFNRDARADLVVTNSFDGTISFFVGTAEGFEPGGSLVSGGGFDSGPLGVATGDLNLDGFADVVVANQMEDTVTVLLGDGTGAFPRVNTFDVDSLPTAARIADATGDNLPDIVAVNEGSDSLTILIGDGQGNISDRLSLDTGFFPESVVVRDLNGDGLADLITADSFSDVVSIFAAESPGQFSPRIIFPVGRSPFDVTVGDFNHDGRPDLATANLDDDTVSILLNTTPYSVLHGDVDADGNVDEVDLDVLPAEMFDGDGDLAELLAEGQRRSAPTADANGDGFLTVADMIEAQIQIGRSRVRERD